MGSGGVLARTTPHEGIDSGDRFGEWWARLAINVTNLRLFKDELSVHLSSFEPSFLTVDL